MRSKVGDRDVRAVPSRAVTIVAALVLAAVIFVVRDALPNPNEGVTNLYAVPIAIVAVRFGAVGGAIAALISLALFGVWDRGQSDLDVGPIGYLTRGSAFLFLGVIVGRFSTDRRLLVRRLHELAATDALTGLPNRAKFDADFAAELRRSRRDGRTRTLLVADVDRFKEINDTLGHRVGDDVLKRVARVLGDELRDDDIIARIGGDEFVALLSGCAPGDGESAVERLSRAAERTGRETGVAFTLSVGCISFDGTTTSPPEELLHRADLAMYSAKGAAR